MNNRHEELSRNVAIVRERIAHAALQSGRSPDEITLIAVTKTYPASDVATLIELGLIDFGENRDAEGSEKSQLLKARWHFQGQIQSNKIPSIANWANVVHSLDNPRHSDRLDRTIPSEKTMDVFLQVSLDDAPGRGGVSPDQLNQLAIATLEKPHLRLQGLMAVAPLGVEPARAFEQLAVIHNGFSTHFPQAPYLSSGMSGDFETAIIYGATHVRVGTSILGTRNHPL
ncbi:unannotated protein [freshwater metagenome]|uniref:Unannotated protein n=1 Tax=freshwater metagenome TaxID=449393 RepID=A0A6J6RAE0_9ZZZZ|nr:YggS family pyridoxal phosphate-dependent enzyme [Actinomycetota bacterium]MSV63312.1 YggS family pyridoxal phosphate-dependent enzyme [Actinomycetota bacterium]MSW26126.1 YggS family pyridoxal phosphate-dependent enzyme [Actinomycetota bacterium]MSW33739.1 YggS family pyridoxal phosphate-dependent enzyme [Actinomycetota bacterium]MSX31571.1 YggS family pyridoxal phosphate-dependent enzyme [Actinomycetota bacterium]